MTASQRLEALVAYMHTNVKALADLCGYDRPQAFYDILKGKTRNISPTVCDRLISVFPNLSRVWLITGEGEMIDNSQKIEENHNNVNKSEVAGQQPQPFKMVPLVQLAACAGPLESYYQEGIDLKQCQWVPSPTPQAEFAIPVTGDSMEPIFPDGVILFIKKINERSFIPWGHAMVLNTENGVFVKNVLPDNDNAQYIWAESVNPKYPKMHIPTESIYSWYRVLTYVKSFFAQ